MPEVSAHRQLSVVHTQDHTFTRQGLVPWRLNVPLAKHRRYCLLWVNGWSTAMDDRFDFLVRISARLGIATATLDTAGHGRSTVGPLGRTTPLQQLAEVEAVYDELISHGYEGVVVGGESFGGYLAAVLTGTRPAAAAVLDAPGACLEADLALPADESSYATDPARYLFEASSQQALAGSAASRALLAFAGSVQVVEHELDEVVPAAVPRHYARSARYGTLLLARAVPHSAAATQAHQALVEDLLASALTTLLPPSS